MFDILDELSPSKEKFVLIYIEVDLLKMIISKLCIYHRIFEGMHHICFTYDRFGQHKEVWPMFQLKVNDVQTK